MERGFSKARAKRAQSVYLRATVRSLRDWEAHAKQRWPGAQADGETWHATYVRRAPLGPGFLLAADKIRAITAAVSAQYCEVRALLPTLLGEVMNQVHEVGEACAK